MKAARAILAALVAAYAGFFSFWTCLVHDRFQTAAYDLGTFDQGIWLAGHTATPFVTVRGLHLLGDHVRVFSYVLAPLYYLADDVRALLVLQTLVVAAGAWLVFRLSLDALPARPWTALALGAAWLLHPAVQNVNLEQAHPDAFASTLILASVLAWRRGRIVAFAVAMALAMSCKEDVPLVFAALGVVLMLEGRRRAGAAVALVASTYFLLCMFVILPHFNGHGFFRFDEGGFLGGAGSSAGDPAWFVARVLRAESGWYLWKLAAPFLFVFVLAPRWLLPALPALAANLLSDVGYTRSFDYHYQTSIMPFLFVATIDAIRRMSTLLRPLSGTLAIASRAAAPAVLAAVIAANLSLGGMPLHRLVEKASTGWHALRNDPAIAEIRGALERIPSDAIVTAHWALVPHLTHRPRIYMFPNPFRTRYWGIREENPHDPDDVEYIVVRVPGDDRQQRMLSDICADERCETVESGGHVLLVRRKPREPVSEHASCGDWNGDGVVAAEDARAIGRAIMSERECPLRVCDADGDGALRYADVIRIDRSIRGAQPLACPP